MILAPPISRAAATARLAEIDRALPGTLRSVHQARATRDAARADLQRHQRLARPHPNHAWAGHPDRLTLNAAAASVPLSQVEDALAAATRAHAALDAERDQIIAALRTLPEAA